MQVTRIDYSDGSNNAYHVWPDRIEYWPMKPALSSSGFYDGGEAKNNAISMDKFEVFSKLVLAIVEKTAGLEIQRQKGTGLLSVYEGEQRRSIVLAWNSEEQLKLETDLKSLLTT